jgi:parallel beta-helix repeat protein
VFQYNIVKNCYDVNENHDDGFQSWSVGDSGDVGTGVVYGIVLRGNTIINYENAEQPFRGALQGIGCFDGMFENWVVENNVVITDHWHGITLSGATNCIIVNNTVVDINDTTPGPPWIRISEHKDGRKSSGCVVRNNLTTSISCDTPGVVIDHNLIVTRYEDFFVGYETKNMHLRAGCTAIDAGINGGAPATDRDALSRPVGSSVDIGAYEYRASNICLSANRIASQNQFAFERQGGTLMVLLPLTGGTLSLFDLSGRRLESILCTGDQCVIPYRNRGLTRSLIAQYAVGDKKFVSYINTIK